MSCSRLADLTIRALVVEAIKSVQVLSTEVKRDEARTAADAANRANHEAILALVH
jgi:hypothetical protein